MNENDQKPCTSPLRRVTAKARQAVINGHEMTKQACLTSKRANIALFANAFRKTHLFSGHYDMFHLDNLDSNESDFIAD